MAYNAGAMYANLGLRVTGIAQSQQAFTSLLKNVSKDVQNVQARLTALEAQAKRTGRSMATSMTGGGGVKKAVEETTNSVNKMSAAIFQSAQRYRTFGYLTSIVLTAPMVLAGKAAINTAKDFNFAMSKITGLVGIASTKVAGLRKELIQMAPALAQTPQALAEAAYFTTSAGFKDTAQTLKIVETAAKGATAGLGEASDVAKLLVFSMNAYRQSGMTAAKAADIFTAAVREGAIEAEGFAGSMQSVLPIASALGIRLEEVAGTMAAMSLQGASAQNAAVYLKGVMNALLKLKPGSGGGKELEKMGVKVDDLIKKLRSPGGLMKVLIQLKELSKGVGGVPFLKNVFRDIRAMTGDLALMGDNFAYNEQVINAVRNAAGDLGVAFNTQGDQMKKRLDAVKASMDALKISFGEALGKVFIPLLEKAVNALTGLVNGFNNLSDGAQKTIVKILGLVAAIGPLALMISVIKYVWGGVFLVWAKRIGAVRMAVKGLGGDLSAMGEAAARNRGIADFAKKFSTKVLNAGGWASFFRMIGKGLTSFSRVAGPVALVGSAIVAGTVAVVKYTKKVKEMVKAHDDFYKVTIQIKNGLAKLYTIEDSDIENMTLDQLIKARERLEKSMQTQAHDINTWIKSMNDAGRAEGKYTKEIEKRRKQYEVTKGVYEAMGNQIEVLQMQWSADQQAREAAAGVIGGMSEEEEEFIKKLQEEWETIKYNIAAIDERAKAMERAKKPYDAIKEKVDVLIDGINTLTSETYKQKFDSTYIQQLLAWLAQLDYSFSETAEKSKKFAKDLQNDIESINLRKLMLGPVFDENSAKLKIFEKAFQDYADILTSVDDVAGVILTPTNEQLDTLQTLLQLMEKYQRLVQESVDRESLALLNAEADAFGNLAGKIEVLNYELEASGRYLKDLLKRRYKGEFIDPNEIKRTVERIQNVKIALVDLENQQDITYLENMNRGFLNLNSNTDLLEGHISGLANKLRLLSEMGKGDTAQFKALVDQMHLLQYTKVGVDRLGDSINTIFDTLIDGGDETLSVWQRIGDSMGEILKGLIKDAVHLFIKMKVLEPMMAMFKLTGKGPPKAGVGSLADWGGAGLLANTGVKEGIGKLLGSFAGTNQKDPNKLIPNPAALDKATKSMDLLSEATKQFGLNSEEAGLLANIFNKILGTGNITKQVAVGATGALAAAEQIQSSAIKESTAVKAAAIPVETALTAKEAASVPVTEAKASADAGAAVAGAMKGAGKLPFPLNIAALGISVAAVMFGIAAIIKARKAAKAAEGGIVPQGFPNDSFPALLTSGEIILPEDKMKKIFGRDSGIQDALKNNISVLPKLAKGGIIPSGFPNDSYPALLSSNEAVIPLDKIQRRSLLDDEEGEVVFRLGQDELYGLLKKKMKRTTIY